MKVWLSNRIENIVTKGENLLQRFQNASAYGKGSECVRKIPKVH